MVVPFLANFPNLGGGIFSRKSGSIIQNFKWVSSICQKLEKTNDTILRKPLDRQKAGWKDKQKDGQTDPIL